MIQIQVEGRNGGKAMSQADYRDGKLHVKCGLCSRPIGAWVGFECECGAVVLRVEVMDREVAVAFREWMFNCFKRSVKRAQATPAQAKTEVLLAKTRGMQAKQQLEAIFKRLNEGKSAA